VLNKDADYFLELQTHTSWSRTLFGFARWCEPKPGWLTLDVGCGPGLLPAVFSSLGCMAVGVDIDMEMFRPTPLHPIATIANAQHLPFKTQCFDLVTATNLLFLLPQPVSVLVEMKRLLNPGGKVALLNPSEKLTELSARAFAEEQGLTGMAKDTLVNWATRAEHNYRWTEAETRALFAHAGMRYMGSILKVGPGFGRFSWATA
jgi:ubiquinone/menaquinone biosynthesis C-methylase UbiE